MGVAESYRGPSGAILPGLGVELGSALSRLRELFRQNGAALAYLFGSHALDEAEASSDIDIAILLDQTPEGLYAAYRRIMLGLQEALQTERFDLVLLNDAPPTLQFEVVCHGRPIYSRNEQVLNDFEMSAIRKFQDTAHLRAVQNEYLKQRAREWYSSKRP
ncbi:MAG TPA: nucleotidyltransferase domain-containing protein [Desulfotomaculum sp.]|nr:nucleotidyltransferase domain-containing protein [Desulfotomaculum sp.]